MAQQPKQHIPDDILFDIRLVKRHIARGATSRADLDARLAAMPDQAKRVDLDQLAAAGRGKRPG